MRSARIPVLLLTGGLGSGKTTLLAAWLRQPELRNAALVINEVGEVGLDDRLLLPMVQAGEGALLANTCICCTGLPGLEQAMADLYRARLERRIARFDAVVIETTGLAEPQPVRQAFATDTLLRERYVLLGVVTTASAAAPEALAQREEVQAQVRGADVVVVTKTDRMAPGPVEATLRALNAQATVLRSALADLPAAEVLALLRARLAPDAPATPAAPLGALPPAVPHHHGSQHHRHAAEAVFVAMPRPVPRAALAQALQRCTGIASLLRVKGVVRAEDGGLVAVQWAPGDAQAVLLPFTGTPPATGLTVIAADAAGTAQVRARIARL